MKKLTGLQLKMVEEFGIAVKLWRKYKSDKNYDLASIFALDAIQYGLDLGLVNSSFDPFMFEDAKEQMKKYPHSNARYLTMIGINDLQEQMDKMQNDLKDQTA